MDQYCQEEAEKSSTTAALSPSPPSPEHSPPLIQELLDNGGEEYDMGSHIVEGFLYEIDHVHLPTGTPSQLRSVRVAMVREKTNLNIEVRFPSMVSLREFFNDSNREAPPALDEKFVMGKDLAVRVLVKIVPVDTFAQQKCLESFWLISSVATEMCKDNDSDEESKGSCSSVLKGNGIKYLGLHEDNDCSDGNVQNLSSNFVYGVGKEEEEEDLDEAIESWLEKADLLLHIKMDAELCLKMKRKVGSIVTKMIFDDEIEKLIRELETL